MKLSLLHRKFLADLRGWGRTASTEEGYASDFNTLLGYLGRDDLRALTPRAIEKWPGWMLRKGLAAATIKRRMDGLRSFTGWLRRRGDVREDLFRDVPPIRRVRGLPRPVPTSVADAFLRVPFSARDRALWLCMRNAGLRVGECIRLDLADYNPLTGVLVLRETKGRRDRAVPADRELQEALTAWCLERGPGDGALFPGRLAPRLKRKVVARMLDREQRRHGIPKFTCHQLRHSFATEAIGAGVDVRTLQELLGHQDLETTARYVKVTSAGAQQAIARLEAWRAGLRDPAAATSRVPVEGPPEPVRR